MEATTIIWATDGSDRADRALEFVHDLAQNWTTPPRIVPSTSTSAGPAGR
jgi:hypothetical protein